MDEEIIEGLDSLHNLELFVLYYDIKHVIEDKEISEETISNAIKDISKGSSLGERVPYDQLTLYLESKGYNRESISKKILDLIGVGKLDFVQSWTTKMHPIYEGKERIEVGIIYFPEEKYVSDYIKEILQNAIKRQQEEKKKEKLYDLPMETLLELQESVKIILSEREIDTGTVSHVIKHLCNIYHEYPWIRYTALTLFLEKAGFRRESISRELGNMVEKGILSFSRYPPFPEEKETPENPVFTLVDGTPIVHIYCKKFRGE